MQMRGIFLQQARGAGRLQRELGGQVDATYQTANHNQVSATQNTQTNGEKVNAKAELLLSLELVLVRTGYGPAIPTRKPLDLS